ncbi:MAG: CHAT domain-containing tetratricopeptide repeat protein [Planctomycetota bacterium]
MILPALCLLAFGTTQEPSTDDLLRPGAPVEGSINSTDGSISMTPALRLTWEGDDGPPGDRVEALIAEPGQYTLFARSPRLTLYLVLRDSEGEILGEDRRSLWAQLPAIPFEVTEENERFSVDIAGLFAETGSYELLIVPGSQVPTVQDGLQYMRANAPDEDPAGSYDHRLGSLLSQIDRTSEEAVTAFRRALEKRRAAGQPQQVVETSDLLAGCLYFQSRFAEALEAQREAFETERGLVGTDHPEYATAALNYAQVLFAAGQGELAERYYLESVDTLQRLPDPDPAQLGISLSSLGGFLFQVRRPNEALPHLEKAVELLVQANGESSIDVATTLSHLGVTRSALNDLDGAASALERSVRILRAELSPGDPTLGTGLINLAFIHQRLGRFEEAKADYREALPCFDREPYPKSILLNNLAQLHYSEGEYTDALELNRRSLELRLEIHSRESLPVATSYNNLGIALTDLARFEEAEEAYATALRIRRSLLGPDHEETLQTENNLAVLLQRMGRPREAERRLRDAVAAHTAAGRASLDVASALTNLANLLQAQGRVQEAEPYLRGSLDMQRLLLRPDDPRLSTPQGNLASCLTDLGQIDEAKKLFEQAMASRDRAHWSGSQRAVLLDNYCRVLSLEGRVDEAAKARTRALEMLPDSSSVAAKRARIARKLADDLMRLGDIEKAETTIREAIRIEEAIPGRPSSGIASSQILLARLLVERGEHAEARELYESAFEIQEAHRTDTLAEGRARSLQAAELNHRTTSYRLARLQHQAGDRLVALGTAERGKARALLDLLPGAHGSGQQTQDDALSTLEAAVRERELAAARLEKLLQLDGKADPDLEERIEEAKSRADSTRIAAEAAEFRYLDRLRSTWAPTEPASGTDIRAALAPGDLLLSYAWETDHPHAAMVFVVTPGEAPELLVLEASDEKRNLDTECQRFVEAVTSRASSEELEASTEQLADRVLPASLREHLSRAKRVIIVPDGPLANVPFEPLLEHSGIEAGTVYAPSATLYLRSATRARREKASRAVVLGDPAFEPGDETWTRLPHAREEAMRLAELLRNAELEVQMHLDSDASLPRLRRSVDERPVRILHIATHGSITTSWDPNEAFVLLAAGESAAGRLSLDRLMRSWEGRLEGCDLVTLSACETNRGVRLGDSDISLPWGFFFAGARSVLASLWQVDSFATTLLMVRFYENMLGEFEDTRSILGESYSPGRPMPKSTALGEAKRWLRRRDWRENRSDFLEISSASQPRSPRAAPESAAPSRFDFSHPYYWAGFVLIGAAD